VEDFRITIASLPDRENLVAEISYKSKQVAEINQETKKLIIQIYAPSKEKDYWDFSLDEFQKVVEEAKQRLIEVG